MRALRIGAFAQRMPDEAAGFVPIARAQGLRRAVEVVSSGALTFGLRRFRALSALPGGGVGGIAEEDAPIDERRFMGTASTEELRAAFQKALGLVRRNLHPARSTPGLAHIMGKGCGPFKKKGDSPPRGL